MGAPSPVVDRASPERLWNRARHLLLACGALVVLAALLVGERSTTLDQLDRDVATARVHAVRVVGALPRGSTGYAVVEVHWRRGLLGHVTEVVQQRPRGQAPDDVDGHAVVTGDIGAHLSALQPGLRVTRDPELPSGSTLWGWHLPTWLGLVTVTLALAVLWLLVNGPEPWRATRWAWFWLLASPVGIIAFLVLSGPTRSVPAPPDTGRRMTGGWALLLSVVVTPMLVPG